MEAMVVIQEEAEEEDMVVIQEEAEEAAEEEGMEGATEEAGIREEDIPGVAKNTEVGTAVAAADMDTVVAAAAAVVVEAAVDTVDTVEVMGVAEEVMAVMEEITEDMVDQEVEVAAMEGMVAAVTDTNLLSHSGPFRLPTKSFSFSNIPVIFNWLLNLNLLLYCNWL